MQVRQSPSPNHDTRGDTPIDILLLHYTGMKTGEEALARLRDPEAKVSAHYFVEEDGSIHQLVDEDQRAWHAGKAFWAGETDINARSIGIEIVNPGHEWGYRDFPASQIDAVLELCTSILGRHSIAPARVLGHSDVAPARKQDPGEKFPWAHLASHGVGVWPSVISSSLPRKDSLSRPINPDFVRRLKGKFARFGYEVSDNDDFDTLLSFNVIALLRHFWHPETHWEEPDPQPPYLEHCELIMDDLLGLADNCTPD